MLTALIQLLLIVKGGPQAEHFLCVLQGLYVHVWFFMFISSGSTYQNKSMKEQPETFKEVK